MTDSNDVQALEKISTEVDESQLNIVLSIQCIKGMYIYNIHYFFGILVITIKSH